jgi:hypothetical protein
MRCGRGGFGYAQRHAEHRICTKPAFTGRAVKPAQQGIDPRLILGIHAANGFENFAVHGLNRLAHALAAVAPIAIAQFVSLMRAGRGTGRHGGAAA